MLNVTLRDENAAWTMRRAETALAPNYLTARHWSPQWPLARTVPIAVQLLQVMA